MHHTQNAGRHGSNGPHANATHGAAPVSRTHTAASTRFWRLLAPPAFASMVVVSLAGCAQDGTALAHLQTGLAPTQTGSIGSATSPSPATGTDAVIAKARDLQSNGNPKTAAQMLGQAFSKARQDENLRRAYAIAALEAGDAQLAYKLTSRDHAPANADPRQLSIRGAALSTLGHHDKAQQAFASALALSPDDPTLLNNLAMALIMKGNAKKAELLLRRAAPTANDDRTRHNLALALSLQGRIGEAKKVALTRPAPAPASAPTPALEPALEPAATPTSWNGTVKTSLGGPVPTR